MRFVSCGFARAAAAAAFLASASIGASQACAAVDQAWEVASSLAASSPPPGLRLIVHEGSEDPAAGLDRLERAGFHIAVALPPYVYYAKPTASGATEALPPGFAFQGSESPPGTAASSARSPGSLGAEPGANPPDFDLFEGREDALPPCAPNAALRSRRVAMSGALQGLPFGARWTDTSEFMLGRVAVSILFPESDGTTDPNHYDWTPALRDSVVRSAVRGFAHWSAFAALRGINLTFALEVHPGLATRYEPIDRTAAEEDNWIQDVLTGYLGYRSDAITLAFDAANGVRSRLGAQWSALVFAVQDDSSSTGKFADGLISHARLGGPFFVTPVKNGGSALQGATLDTYMEHELAHIFWALDEHLPFDGWWACSLRTGYFNHPNFNSLVPAAGYCGTQPVQCFMKGNYPDSICVFTEGQVGWADRDQNGIPDLLETHAVVFPDSETYRVVEGTPITLRGRALEIALPNQNPYHYFAGDTISIATIDSVRYTIDQGPPTKALAVDGAFDSGQEYFSATLPPLPTGDYVVRWDVWNSNGVVYAQNGSTSISVRAPSSPAGAGDGAPVSGGPALRFGPTPTGGPVHFSLHARPGSAGWGTLHDVRGRLVARWRLVVPSSGTADWIWSGRVGSGAALPSGLYFLSVEIDGAAMKRRLVISH
jgi:hypothetical protein